MVKKFAVLFFSLFLVLFVPGKVQAAKVPTITGQVRNATTDAPIPGVWVAMTSAGCPACEACQQAPGTRYEQTDINGVFSFAPVIPTANITAGGSCNDPRVGQLVDTDLDGSNDTERIPDINGCIWPSTDSSGNPIVLEACTNDFGCFGVPFSFTGVLPDGWSGSFDVISDVNFANAAEDFTIGVGTLYYYDSPPPPPVNPPPTVSITFPWSGASVIPGQAINLTAQASDDSAVASVEFFVNGTSVGVDTTGVSGEYSVSWVPPGAGVYTVVGEATDDDGDTTVSSGVTFSAAALTPWWQVSGGPVISGGNIISRIPVSCISSPTCQEYLILENLASPTDAVAVFSGTADLSADSGSSGEVSASGRWLVNSATRSNIYNYALFENLASSRIFTDLGTNAIITTGDINSAFEDGSYAWIRADGEVSLGAAGGAPMVQVNNKKVILMVDGDLTIYDRVDIQNIGNGFLMVIVSGNIDVSPDVVSSGLNDPAIEGLYLADGTFSTGTTGGTDELLVIQGSVAAASLNLERDTGAASADAPSEYFIYSPELIVGYPSQLSEKHLRWQEAAP